MVVYGQVLCAKKISLKIAIILNNLLFKYTKYMIDIK